MIDVMGGDGGYGDGGEDVAMVKGMMAIMMVVVMTHHPLRHVVCVINSCASIVICKTVNHAGHVSHNLVSAYWHKPNVEPCILHCQYSHVCCLFKAMLTLTLYLLQSLTLTSCVSPFGSNAYHCYQNIK